MPEYLAPGVYVEETSFRAKSIEGVSTSTAAFVGPTRFGPTRSQPELVTSFAEFERIFGGMEQLEYDGPMHNYMAHAVRNYFEEGGRRLYVARAYKPSEDSGQAQADLTEDGDLLLKARWPGAAGNVPVRFTFKVGPNILGLEPVDPAKPGAGSYPVLRGASNQDLVWVKPLNGATLDADPVGAGAESGYLFWLERYFDGQRYTYKLRSADPGAEDEPEITLYDLLAGAPADPADPTDPTDPENPENPETPENPEGGVLSTEEAPPAEGTPIFEVRLLTVSLTMGRLSKYGPDHSWENLTFHPAHSRSLHRLFAAQPDDRSTELYVPLVLEGEQENGRELATLLLEQLSMTDQEQTIGERLAQPGVTDADLSFQVLLAGGSDGDRPGGAEYEGIEGADGLKSGLKSLEDIEDISIVAAPGSTFGYKASFKDDADQITRLLISHCHRMRYRVAVLDAPNDMVVSEIRAFRAQYDSTHAALYYPWLRVLDPVTGQQISLPPSGFVAGIYARNDVEHGVHKAPANEVVRSAIGLQLTLNTAQQDVLNPEGINCFRFFEGRGIRLWGARTISSDPEWKYVNVRRYFAYLERSIDKGTQWVVFMNNMDSLWSRVRQTIEDFLFNEWKSERLMGTKPEDAYFVRCDRSTMTQNDLDNGRLICLVGVSPVRPAEYVIFRIGQWTADRQS